MKPILIFFLLLTFSNRCFCQDWVLAGEDSDGDKWYVKSSYVKKGESGEFGDNIRIWTKRELKKKTIKKGAKSLTYTNVKQLSLMITDCSSRKIKTVSVIFYSSQGKVIDSWTVDDYEQQWRDVVPDSIGEVLLDKICELHN